MYRYIITNGQKDEISRQVIPRPSPQPGPEKPGRFTTLSITYLVLPDGSRSEVPGGKVPSGSHYVVVLYIVSPDGTRTPISEEEFIPGSTGTKYIVYTIVQGQKRVVTTQEIPATTTLIIR